MKTTHRVFLLVAALLGFGASALAGAPSGWRTDWSGRYPQAKPALTWSKTQNVLWQTKTPGWGNTTPVVVGDKVFFSIEKMTLACAALKDGKVLWKKSVDYMESLSAEDRAKADEALKKMAEIGKEAAPVNKELRNVSRKLRKDRKNKELRAKVGELRKKLAAINAKMKPYAKFKMPPTHGTNGYSSPTPVTDGKQIYVLYGPGIVACYDLAGNRKWLTLVERPRHGWGHSASPVLIDGTLVIHVINVFGLDPATGKQRWKAPSQAHWGSPVPARIGEAGVVVTTNGEVIRVSDGNVLAKGLFKLTYGGPVLHEGVIYAIDMGSAVAVKVPASGKPSPLWKVKVKKDRYYASPLVHEGVVYAMTQKGILTALDVKDGKKLYERQCKELGRGTTYPSLVLAGKHMLVSIDNGTTLVVQPGKEFKLVGQNRLEAFRATPVFAGNRMVVRTLKGLFCIGAK